MFNLSIFRQSPDHNLSVAAEFTYKFVRQLVNLPGL
jgi:hypothetical protein